MVVKVLIKKTSAASPEAQHSRGVRMRPFALRSDFPTAKQISDELQEMRRLLLGTDPPPVDLGPDTMMEVANGYFARAAHIASEILRGEREGSIKPKSDLYLIRTGELRTFMEMAKSATDLGSRRLTARRLAFEQQQRGLDSPDADEEGS